MLLSIIHFDNKAMKNVTLFIIAALLYVGNSFAQLATYAGSGGGGTTVTGVANETVSTLMFTGFGTNTPCGSGGLSGITVNTSWATYSTAGPRVFIKITPNPGFQLNVTGFNSGMRRSGTGPTCVRFAYSLDNGATWIDDAACHAPNNAGCGTTAVSNWSGGPLPTAITSTTNGIIVALFPYAASNSSGTYQVNTFNILGNVTSACTPPAAITGPSVVCAGPSSSAVFSDATPGGTWSSSNTAIATIGSSSGILTGILSGTATITYSTGPTCFSTKTVTINPLPAAITGSLGVCVGFTTTLSNAPGGTWSSSNTAIATIGSATGIVSALVPGTSAITYTLGTGCSISAVLVVHPLPAAITGVTNVCVGSTTSLSSGTGGTWSSGTTSVATVTPASGFVSGISAGTAAITYTALTGCHSTTTVTVDPLPTAIAGSTSVCTGLTTSLSNSMPGGTWSSGNTGVATINTATGVTTGITPGTATITYTLATGCSTTTVVTVNALPPAITGTTAVCSGLTASLTNTATGGTWSSSALSVVAIGSGTGIYTGLAAGTSTITYTATTGCMATIVVTVNLLPPAISGPSSVCLGAQITLTNSGGTWASSNSTVATIHPATGIVTGLTTGTTIITYTVGTGCFSTTTITVNPLPSAISGITNVCPASTVALSNSGGGTWGTLNSSVATAGLSTGIVTGISAGTAEITYKLSTGCTTSVIVTVNPLPATITGVFRVCAGLTTALSNATPGGTWTSAPTFVATVDATTGVATGIAAGTATIVYTIGTGCSASATLTVDALPATVTGSTNVCAGATTLFSSSGSGTWSSSNTTVASISAPGIGMVSGITAGTATITYTLATGCMQTTVITVNPLPAPITGLPTVCQGSFTTLSDVTPSGVWTSSNTSIANIHISSGTVTGIAGGAATITYTLVGTGCSVTRLITVDPIAPITGVPYLCTGVSATLSNSITGGTWSSSNTSVASIVTGTGKLSGITPGTSVIFYTASTGCISSRIVTINPFPAPISGKLTVCEGATTALSSTPAGGTWTSSRSDIATAGIGTGIVSGILTGTSIITYSHGFGCTVTGVVTVNVAVAPITDVHDMCSGGSQITVKNADAPKGIWTSSVVTVTTGGLVTAYPAGVGIITYTLPTGCYTTATLTVHPLPGKITGVANLCEGTSVTLSDLTSGGTWSSTDPVIAIDVTSGILVGVSPGTAVVSYTLPTGCGVADTITVHRVPASITGSPDLCIGATSTLSNAVGGGLWSSPSGSIISVGSTTGVVSGLSTGTATVSYTIDATCSATMTFTVLPSPSVYSVTGGGSMCAGDPGAYIKLSSSTAGINYKLYDGIVLTATLPGTGTALNYGRFATPGTFYILAENTATTCSKAMYGSATVTVNPVIVPTVSINVTPGNSVCAGTVVTLKANAVDGGTLPAFDWRINGFAAASGNTYSYVPVQGDVVGVEMKSNATCADPAPAFDYTVMSVTDQIIPNVTITANPGTNIISNQSVTFTASVSNGVFKRSYQWKLNGAPIPGATDSIYTGTGFSNYDSISCIVTANDLCALSGSARVYMNVNTTHVSNLYREDWQIIPNPNSGSFTITGTLNANKDAGATITISNLLGQVVYSNRIITPDGVLKEHIALGGTIANGQYLLNIGSPTTSKIFHIVIEQ